MERIMTRNISEIKCPRDLEEKGIITELDDIRLRNMNQHSAINKRRRNETDSES